MLLKESFNVNLESAIENYNAENEIPFQSPEQMRLSIEEEMERLNTIFGGVSIYMYVLIYGILFDNLGIWKSILISFIE